MLKIAVLLVLFIATSTCGFVVRPPTGSSSVITTSHQRTSIQPLFMAGPASATETKTKVKQKVKQKSTVKVAAGEPVEKKREKFEDPRMWKVLLIGDEEYDDGHVVERITEIMEDIDENRAVQILKAAQAGGKAMIGVYPLEVAEVYKEQLLRSDPLIYSDLEEENKDN
uniref:Adaptor protein ClpS core domain-containing protein n=1 Tax=Grammatophora oceanica TaxID=210454 RepID=A0A7S1Y2N3_9STRA|mmetsp:Transcript_14501/g.21330  ORF Transcript_14501/g.21330 Transcript_14501/m.21330 type:complete len:169 (+) Transcript_14501:103-609(+)